MYRLLQGSVKLGCDTKGGSRDRDKHKIPYKPCKTRDRTEVNGRVCVEFHASVSIASVNQALASTVLYLVP